MSIAQQLAGALQESSDARLKLILRGILKDRSNVGEVAVLLARRAKKQGLSRHDLMAFVKADDSWYRKSGTPYAHIDTMIRRAWQHAQESIQEAFSGDGLTFYYKGGKRAETKIRKMLKDMGVKIDGHRSRKEQLQDDDDPFWKRYAKAYFDIQTPGGIDEAQKIFDALEGAGLDVYWER